MSSNSLLSPTARNAHFVAGFVVFGMLLGLLWLQTQSLAVVINAFSGMVLALTLGLWIGRTHQQRGREQTSADTEEARNT